MQPFLSFVSRVFKNPRAPVVGIVVAGLIAVTGGAALATRSASDRFADAAFDKLGGDGTDVLDAIADKVVAKITSKGGTLDEAQAQLVDQLAAVAGKKIGTVDPSALVDDVRGEIVAAGLGKLEGISVDEIVAQVTAALIAQASDQIKNIDVNALAKSALNDVVADLNLEKLVKEKIDSLDVDAIVNKAIAEHLGGGSSSGTSNPLSWLSLLLKQ